MGERCLEKGHYLALLYVKAKTITLYPSNENIEFGLKYMTVIRNINFKENFYIFSKEKKFSLSDLSHNYIAN